MIVPFFFLIFFDTHSIEHLSLLRFYDPFRLLWECLYVIAGNSHVFSQMQAWQFREILSACKQMINAWSSGLPNLNLRAHSFS